MSHLLIQFPDSVPGKRVQNGPKPWVPTLMKETEEVPGSQLWASPALATEVLQGVNSWMKDHSLIGELLVLIRKSKFWSSVTRAYIFFFKYLLIVGEGRQISREKQKQREILPLLIHNGYS